MKAEVLSPTFNPRLENFLHRQDSYIISKKNISTAPIACSEDSYLKFSLLSCHDLAQLPLPFSFPVLTDLFLALLADMQKPAREPLAPPSCSCSRGFCSYLFLGVARQELHVFGAVFRHMMQMSREGGNSECYISGQTKSHNPRIV